MWQVKMEPKLFSDVALSRLASGRWASSHPMFRHDWFAGCLLYGEGYAEWKTLIIVYEYCMIFSVDY
jgi:hypothetical protein